MNKLFFSTLLFGLLFSGCGVVSSMWTTMPDSINDINVEVDRDNFSNTTTIRTKMYRQSTDDGENGYELVYRKNSSGTIQLVMTDHNSYLYFPYKAVGEDGYKFQFIKIASDIELKYRHETFALNIPKSQLYKMQQKDYKIKIYNKKAPDGVVTIQKQFSKAFYIKLPKAKIFRGNSRIIRNNKHNISISQLEEEKNRQKELIRE
ncbi:MAG: hypothetical protein U9N59_10280 [Campylobacterota bacterium]|nr:hypothetical protein [Campylobacterota bacterium]